MDRIGIDDFKKVEIRIGEILGAEVVPEADRLLKLRVSFGDEERQIVSGIREYFADPLLLVGRKVAFASNLEPRVIKGLESNGMILAAVGEDGTFSLLEGERNIPPGARVR